MDYLLSEFFNKERWESAIEKGVVKDIDKTQLRRLTKPEVRKAMYNAISNNNYEIAPPHTAKIPKDNGDYRTVYVNENCDRILLSIYNDMLFELCPEMIHRSCVSYQKGIGCGKIVKKSSHLMMVIVPVKDKNGKIIGFKSDLSKYFDSVPIEFIDKIFDMISLKYGKSKITEVVKKYYHTDLYFDTEGNLCCNYQSLKQGCAVASFLADAVLYELDDKLSNLDGYYVRYSDDCLFIGKDYEKAMEIMKTELAKMKMSLNPKKVEDLSPDKWFKFLGFNIKGDKITLSKSRVKTFQENIDKATKNCKNISSATRAVNRVLYGGEYSWATSVLPYINVEEDINTLDRYCLDRIRSCATNKRKIGGLGSVMDNKNYTILRGKGKNVKSNREKTPKIIDGYYSILCMKKNIDTCRPLYETIVRQMTM